MGKGPFSFRRSASLRLRKKAPATKEETPTVPPVGSASASSPPPPTPINSGCPVVGGAGKAKKKAGGARLWMRLDRTGATEVVECDKSTIVKRASVPARDLRILGPVFSQSSNILGREKAIVVNLEFIKAIVTAEEVLLLDPLRSQVLPFVDRLKQHFPQRGAPEGDVHVPASIQSPLDPEAAEGLQSELPFEFQVLEIALEIVCTYIDGGVAALETEAWPILDELTKNVSTENLEYVRSLKSNLTRLLARVQKVRDEIEHLLDDNEDMAHLYLTRKWIQSQQTDATLAGTASNSLVPHVSNLHRLASNRSVSLLTSNLDEDDVEDLEMLLEAYFMQLEGMRNKILSVREYIDDTEDYVNIQLDNQRNELIQLQLVLTIASFAIAVETLVAGIFGMNIPFTWNKAYGVFGYFVSGLTLFCVVLFLMILGYARWKKLLGS